MSKESTESNKSKPLILLYKECGDNLIKVINDSGLPLFIVETIVKDLYHELHIKAQEEYNFALNSYQAQKDNKV